MYIRICTHVHTCAAAIQVYAIIPIKRTRSVREPDKNRAHGQEDYFQRFVFRPWCISIVNYSGYKLPNEKKERRKELCKCDENKVTLHTHTHTLAIVSLMPRGKVAISRQRAMKDLRACSKSLPPETLHPLIAL